jgi:hypothetical protein
MPGPLANVHRSNSLALIVLPLLAPAAQQQDRPPPVRHYVCYRTPAPIIVDGQLTEAGWRAAPSSVEFVDIEGDDHTRPRYHTRFKLLWDDDYLYVGAELEEPHIWATLTKRDAVIYHDNDFEVFIDPDGDTHDYYELEINAFGTVWDLMLDRPYRDRGTANSAWNIEGLRSAVATQGTINDPADRDFGWTVELAIPWDALVAHTPGNRPPRDGEQWRVNFSRVQWQHEVSGGVYQKTVDPATGKPLPESNWVWSPTGAVNMHMPEHWGVVQFSSAVAGEATASFSPPRDEDVRWALRTLYYAQRAYRAEHGRYADDVAVLELDIALDDGTQFRPSLSITAEGYEATARGSTGTRWRIRQDGRIWREMEEQ